jgi:hypothetical protein
MESGYKSKIDKKTITFFGTVKSAWISTIEKLKTDDKSLMTCI